MNDNNTSNSLYNHISVMLQPLINVSLQLKLPGLSNDKPEYLDFTQFVVSFDVWYSVIFSGDSLK